ncbi:helix-turn-helix domain-containing protein [Convivina praedatoris]|uniref:LexA repressor n=1 Tax=Convivina praedatoris TaxID=2880963 RepID=A0ABM9D567_9LACO|nr:S24 family peptidase [Convivina sp. LMG 32447]CAH1854518.1 LexA repressor [Convivina sp. LMG 32447]CAH1855863.1 LexA repressor [Convivina sp. LMG 32447]
MTDTNNFGNKIKQIREMKGFSLRQTAMQAKMSSSYLSQVENSRVEIPTPKTLYKIATGLRIDNDEILKLAGIVPEKIPNELTISSTPATVSIPIYGRIAAGYPEGAKEDIDGNIRIDDYLIKRYGKDNLLALRVNGESMNRIVPNGAVAVLAKIDPSDIANGDVCAVIINGDAATLKHVYQYPDRIRFEPDSWLSDFKPFEYKKDDVANDNPPIQIIGKLVHQQSSF